MLSLVWAVPTPLAHAQDRAQNHGEETYTVRPGDTLRGIAERAGLSLDILISINGLDEDPDSITVGTVLRLPTIVTGAETVIGRLAVPAQQGPSLAAAVPATAPVGLARPQTVPLPSSLIVPTPVPARSVPLASPAATNGAAATFSAISGRPSTGTVVNQAALPQSARTALQFTGAPYVFGGDGPTGFDCSGFVQFVMSRSGKVVPRDLQGQLDAGQRVQSSLEPGDLVFFQNTYEPGLSHVGIYLGSDLFIHAINETSGVGISRLSDSYYAERWFGATRLKG